MLQDLLARPREVARSLCVDGKGWVLVFVALGWLLTLGTRYVFPALFPHLREAFGLDHTALGVLYTLLWATYAVGQFPAGIIGDHVGDRKVLALSTALSAIALLVIGAATGPGPLAVGVIVFGATSALYGPARFTTLTRVFPDYDGTAIGFSEASGLVGNTVLPALAGILATAITWQVGFLYISPLFAVVTIGLWFMIPSKVRNEEDNGGILPAPIREIVAGALSPLTTILTGILAIMMFVIQGITGFYPTYLVEMKEVSPTTAATLFGFLFACGAVVQPLAGALGDTVGTRRALLLMLGILVGSLPLATMASSLPFIVVVTVLLSSMFGVPTITLPRLTNTLPAKIRGSGLGLLRTVYFLIASTGSFAVGVLADRGWFDEAFFILALLTALSLGLTALLDRWSG